MNGGRRGSGKDVRPVTRRSALRAMGEAGLAGAAVALGAASRPIGPAHAAPRSASFPRGPAWSEIKKRASVLGHEMAYVEAGAGDPIVFLHGNPTSSYLWRDIIPHAEPYGRCIAPDLIGMGDSDKLPAEDGPGRYRFVEHRRYLDRFLEAVGASDNVTFVIHDWGSALGFDWIRRHPAQARAVTYMEAIVQPWRSDEMAEQGLSFFRALRSAEGEKMILEDNFFVSQVLMSPAQGALTPADKAAYLKPFIEPGEGRRPTLTWPREVPIDGEPADTAEIVAAAGRHMAGSPIPKLFVNAEPGAILTSARRDFCRTWPNQTEVTVAGNHFIQEQSADEIGAALGAWLSDLA